MCSGPRLQIIRWGGESPTPSLCEPASARRPEKGNRVLEPLEKRGKSESFLSGEISEVFRGSFGGPRTKVSSVRSGAGEKNSDSLKWLRHVCRDFQGFFSGSDLKSVHVL